MVITDVSLEKVKILIFTRLLLRRGRRPPHQGETFFFAFLDELGYFKHKLKSVIITPEKVQ